MKLIVDTHLHIYPQYKIEVALGELYKNLNRLMPGALKAACLTERSECHIFDALRDNPPQAVKDHFDIDINPDQTLRISPKNAPKDNPAHCVHLLPGQQIITSDRLEILALNMQTRVPEGLTTKATVQAVLDAGGLPVVAWSPGKWFFGRKHVVDELLDCFSPRQLALGDTTLRPTLWMTPLLMKKAKANGFKVLFGSDPLPFRGEENKPGSYVSVIMPDKSDPASERPANQSTNQPGATIKNLLQSDSAIIPVGKRGTPVGVATRILRNEWVRRR